MVGVDQYDGRPTVTIACTQLGERDYTRAQAARILAEWCEFFAAGASPIRELEFVSRTPERLFASLVGQTQLESLNVKWGDYEDLSVLQGMTRLHTLRLRGASGVRSLKPLGTLTTLTGLQVEGLKHLIDLGPLAALTTLDDLEIGGDWMSSRSVHVPSIGVLREMPQLRHLVLHTLIVDDHDYTPLLALPNLETLRVARTRGMRPSHDELAGRIPALQRLP